MVEQHMLVHEHLLHPVFNWLMYVSKPGVWVVFSASGYNIRWSGTGPVSECVRNPSVLSGVGAGTGSVCVYSQHGGLCLLCLQLPSSPVSVFTGCSAWSTRDGVAHSYSCTSEWTSCFSSNCKTLTSSPTEERSAPVLNITTRQNNHFKL